MGKTEYVVEIRTRIYPRWEEWVTCTSMTAARRERARLNRRHGYARIVKYEVEWRRVGVVE